MYDDVVEETDPMHPTPENTRLTYEDFLLFPDDGKRHEIIDGEHLVTPSPNTRHQVLVGRLHFAIEQRIEQLILRRKVRVDERLARAGGPGELLDGQGQVALFHDHAGGGVEDLRPAQLRRQAPAARAGSLTSDTS